MAALSTKLSRPCSADEKTVAHCLSCCYKRPKMSYLSSHTKEPVVLPIVKAFIITIVSIIFAVPVMAEAPPVVLFDQGHNQRFLVNREGRLQLTGLAGIFKAQGFRVAPHERPIDPQTLAGIRALVISGPFNPFTPSEIESIAGYLDKGGNLAVMLHIGVPLTPLLDLLGVRVSGNVIHEQENILKDNDLYFKVTRLESGPLTSGVEQFSFYGGWGLMNDGPDIKVVATTGEKSWIDLNGDRKLSTGDALQPFAVIVSGTYGKGRFVVFGDDAIFQNQFLDDNNSRLATNLAHWLK